MPVLKEKLEHEKEKQAERSYLDDYSATVAIKCSDSTVEAIAVRVLVTSSTVRTILEGKALDDKSPIDMSFMNAATLKHAIQWIEHHLDDPSEALQVTGYFSAWDKQFFDCCSSLGDCSLTALLNGAIYLDLSRLIDQICSKLLRAIKGASVEQIRETFQIKQTSFNEQTKKRMESEHSWLNNNGNSNNRTT